MCKSRVVPKIEMWSVENSFPGRALQARGKARLWGSIVAAASSFWPGMIQPTDLVFSF